jgi:predicted amidophosphoribosyltransferase
VTRARDVPELKNVYDYNDRTRLLAGAHSVDKAQVQGRKVLLFDDLYRSGATMNAISAALYDDGGAADVFALTITKTRSNQ